MYKFLKIAALLLDALCDPSQHPPFLSRPVSTMLALSSSLLWFSVEF